MNFLNLLIFGQCEIFEFEDFFGIFSINWTNSKDCRYQWSLVSDKMIRLDSLTIEWPGHQLLHHRMNFVLNHDGWLSNDDYRHQREDNMSVMGAKSDSLALPPLQRRLHRSQGWSFQPHKSTLFASMLTPGFSIALQPECDFLFKFISKGRREKLPS